MLRTTGSVLRSVRCGRSLQRFSSAAPGASAVEETPQSMVLCNVDSDGIATVTLNRPHLFNAFSDVVIARCSDIFDALKEQKGTLGVHAGRRPVDCRSELMCL
jgi:hypothetical protein